MSYITFFENLAVLVPTADGRPSLSGGLLYRPMHDGALEDFFIGVNRTPEKTCKLSEQKVENCIKTIEINTFYLNL